MGSRRTPDDTLEGPGGGQRPTRGSVTTSELAPDVRIGSAGSQSRCPAAVWGTPGSGDQGVSDVTLRARQRAEEVALQQSASAKEREDSVLRMLDNRAAAQGNRAAR